MCKIQSSKGLFWTFAEIIIERPPGVPFQKIQFGNERGGRSVLSRLPELRIARILALLRCLILCPLSLCYQEMIGVLPQHYFPMDISTEIFPTRAFQMGVSGVLAGVWGVLTEKFHSSKLMGPMEPREMSLLYF